MVTALCAALAALLLFRWAAAPTLTVDPTFMAGAGVGEHISEDASSAAGSAPGFQATAVTATVRATVRNDGRFAVVVRGHSNPPNVTVRFVPADRPGQDGTAAVRIAPGAEAIASVTVTGKLCSPDDRGSATYRFGLRATSLGVSTDASASSQIVFNAETLPPSLCDAIPAT